MVTISSHRSWGARDTALAVAKLPFIPNNARELAQVATRAGFRDVGNGAYQHADGSWVALVNGRIERGHGNAAFQGLPSKPAPPTAPNRGTSRTPIQNAVKKAVAGVSGMINNVKQAAQQLGTVTKDNSRPAIPKSMKGYALAKIGRVNSATAAAACARAGFVQVGDTWVHPDGSWVAVRGAISVGWKGYPLAELPYRRSGGWQ